MKIVEAVKAFILAPKYDLRSIFRACKMFPKSLKFTLDLCHPLCSEWLVFLLKQTVNIHIFYQRLAFQ